MNRQTRTLAIGGVGIAAAVALGLTGATIAGAAGTPSTTPSATASAGPDSGGSSGTMPGGARGGMMDAGGTLTADAASKAVAAAQQAVSGGTVTGVRAMSDGTYEVTVVKDSSRVDVLLSSSFAVTGTEDHSGGPDGDGPPDRSGSGAGSGTGSTSPSDANGTTTTSTV
ncbi:MAG: hypothetical protein IE926_12060 [Micrococcales bacterium]|nr:hypothetical protein [Micrococcales bacterium]